MKFALTVLLLFCACRLARAQEFAAPKTHPIERYEADWQKNPFTLKTAPAVMNRESFAKDFALAGISSNGENTTVILVNTRTREYTRLRNHDPAPAGLRVKLVSPSERRVENFVELELNQETAIVRFDENFLRQVASNQAQPASRVAAKIPALPGSANPATTAAASPPPVVAMNTQPALKAPDVSQIPLPVIGGSAPSSVTSDSQSMQTVRLKRTLRTAPTPHPQADQ